MNFPPPVPAEKASGCKKNCDLSLLQGDRSCYESDRSPYRQVPVCPV